MSGSVDVYLDDRQVKRITAADARVLEAWRKADWRDRAKTTITLLISLAGLYTFLRRRKQKPQAEMRAIDSKTFTKLPGCQGYRHIRNETYAPALRITQ